MRLADFATVVRSKNAGPFVVTFDILFKDAEALERVRATQDLTVETVARAFKVSPNAIRDFAYYPFACAVKFSMMRTTASGSRYDTDVYGAQQYAPLLDMPLGVASPMMLSRRFLVGAGLMAGWSGSGLSRSWAADPDPARSVANLTRLEAVRGSDAPPLRLPTAADQARSQTQFRAAIDYARTTDSDALLIWRKGRLVLAQRFGGHERDARAWSASMMKTVVAVLIGMAIDRGAIRGVDQQAATFLHEWRGDERSKITIRDLLVMTSGLDHPRRGRGDGLAAALALKAVDPPQAVFDYNTQNVTLLMELLARATGRRLADYLSETLWRPLGCGPAILSLDADGAPVPNMLAGAEDWLRIGLLLLRRGQCNGRQLAPASWIDRMMTPSPVNPGYGFLTWIGSPPGNRRSYGSKVAFQAIHSAPFLARDVVFLDGFGGQRVYVMASRGLVIVRTGATQPEFDDAIIANAVVAAL